MRKISLKEWKKYVKDNPLMSNEEIDKLFDSLRWLLNEVQRHKEDKV